MKKFLTIFLTTLFLFIPIASSFAQNIDSEFSEEKLEAPRAEIDEVQEAEEGSKEQESLAQRLQDEQTEELANPRNSFWTILGAILIPSIFIIFIYYIFKTFKF